MPTLTTASEYRTAVETVQVAASACYDTEAETMSDAEYDALIESISAYEAARPEDRIEHGLLTAAGVSGGGVVVHERPMLSLEKAHDIATIVKFQERIGAHVVLELKLDGLAIELIYRNGALVQAVTRGEGIAGEGVTERLATINVRGIESTISDTTDLAVRGELLMSKADFTRTNAARVAAGGDTFANPRNAMAGTLRKSDRGSVCGNRAKAVDGLNKLCR